MNLGLRRALESEFAKIIEHQILGTWGRESTPKHCGNCNLEETYLRVKTEANWKHPPLT